MNTKVTQATSPPHTTKLVPMFAAQGAPVTAMLNDPSARQAWAQEIAADAQQYGYAGVDIDFEHFDPAQRDNFTTFMQTLRSDLPAGAILAVAVDGATSDSTLGGWDLAALATVADQVQIMGYDFHYMGGTHPGPVDPLGWVQAVIAYVSGLNGGATREKFIWGLPNYGIEGPDGYSGGTVSAPQQGLETWIAMFAGSSYSYDASAEFASCPLNADGWSAGLSPNGYVAGGYHAYFDDLDSLEERVSAAATAGLGGITYWAIGDEANLPNDHFPDYISMVRHYFPKGSGSAGGGTGSGDAGTDGSTSGPAASPKIVVPAYFDATQTDPATGKTYWSELPLDPTGAERPVGAVVAECSFPDLLTENPSAMNAARQMFQKLHDDGQLVLGYVDTRFGTAPLESGIENACNSPPSDPLKRVADWYAAYGTFLDANGNATPGLDGIFFDDGPTYDPGIQQDYASAGIPTTESGFQTYYNRLFSEVRNMNPPVHTIFLNASQYPYSWTVDPPAYTISSPLTGPGGQAAVADYVNTFEGPMSIYQSSFVAEIPGGYTEPAPAWWTDGVLSRKTSHVVFDVQSVSDLRSMETLAAQRRPGLVYFLDCLAADSSCPTSGGYGRLPSYWSTEYGDYAQ